MATAGSSVWFNDGVTRFGALRRGDLLLGHVLGASTLRFPSRTCLERFAAEIWFLWEVPT